MKNRLFIIAIVLFVILCSSISWPQMSSGLNPIGPATVPPSSIRSGLVSNPDPIDTSGNLLITGNVRRGRHFRGTVPYQPTTSFSSTLGSASLSSFLRDTAGSEDFGRYSAKYRTQPYYSQSQTVTTMVPGRSGVFRPAGTMVGVRVQQSTRSTGTDVFGLEPLQKQQALSGQGTAAADSVLQVPQTQYSPMVESLLSRAESRSMPESTLPRNTALSQRSTERLASSEIGLRRQGEMSAVERFREQVQDIKDKLQDSEMVQAPESGFLGKKPALSSEIREPSIEDLKSRLESRAPSLRQTKAEKQTAASDHRLPSLDDFTSSIDSKWQKAENSKQNRKNPHPALASLLRQAQAMPQSG